MKFDVIVMNPPYRGQQKNLHKNGRSGKNNSIWEKFVVKMLEMTKDNGMIAAVHPARWRKPSDKMWDIMSKKQICYLEIHNKNDGMKTFGEQCDQRYDWYIMENSHVYKKTTIRDEDSNILDIMIKDISFIPNRLFDLICPLMAKDGEETVEILHSYSTYFSRPDSSGKGKLWMRENKNIEYSYPCVWAIDYKGVPTFHYSNTDKGHFGIPKLIFASGRVSSANYLVDIKGEYGMTQFAKGIVDDVSVLPSIYLAMRTTKFKDIMDACSVSVHEIDKDILSLFRKDFWKEFV